MKIAFIIGSPIISTSNGVLSQAETWKKGLEALGHTVTLVAPWKAYDWAQYDIIHVFMYSEYAADYIEMISKINRNIILSPILDPDFSINKMKFISHWGSKKLRLSNRYFRMRSIKGSIAQFFVRSDFESSYIEQGWGINKEKIYKVPLSYDHSDEIQPTAREPFCFHASFLTDDRKNVERLICAAEKYQFHLKLAGKLRNDSEKKRLEKWLENTKFVEYVGFLSLEKLLEYYRRARVFALPSMNEGVGIVALDAAAMGCDVVITRLGGPKEYYADLASIVNPYDVDEIGNAIVQFIEGKTFQPSLQKFIQSRYSLIETSRILSKGYENLVKNK